MTNVFFKRLCSRSNLFAAWRHVRSRALSSESRDIRTAAEDFDFHAFKNIQSIQSRLTAERFEFPPAEGILKDKRKREAQGKRPRPLVLADIKSRIVQRGLLQCLQPAIDDDELAPRIGLIADINNSRVNFGGTPSGGVPKAIHRVISLINDGHQTYYKSDIGAFFTRIPHDHVLRFIFDQIADARFVNVFRDGLNVQLKNAAQLGEYLDLFPDDNFGVAQGSSLSAFAGNVFLHKTDQKFAADNETAFVRYIDDVIIMAKTNEALQKTKAKFTKELRALGLLLYDPGSAPDKASEGHIRNGIEYLGCVIRHSHIEPSKKAKASLLSKIDRRIFGARKVIEQLLKNADLTRHKEPTFAATIADIDQIVRGWANSFRFVGNRLIFAQLDKEVFKRVSNFHRWLNNLTFPSDNVAARVLGLYQIQDVEHKPLEEFLVSRHKNAPMPQLVSSNSSVKITPSYSLTKKVS